MRATRHLHPAAAAPAPLTEEEKTRAADYRRKAAKKLKLARILAGEDLADEARAALVESGRLFGCTFAVEERLTESPATLAAALAPPLDRRWGDAAGALRALVENAEAPLVDAIAALGALA